jgi:hypothetical protein
LRDWRFKLMQAKTHLTGPCLGLGQATPIDQARDIAITNRKQQEGLIAVPRNRAVAIIGKP